jgi:lysozyme
MRRLVNNAGLALVKSFEGLFLDAYRDIAGVWTIGWGHTGGVYKGQRVTQREAEMLLVIDLTEAAAEVALRAPYSTDNQFAAMVSLAFNIGIYGYRGSTVLRKHKASDFAGAAKAFELWNKAHVDGELVAVRGLTRRRKAEAALYLSDE